MNDQVEIVSIWPLMLVIIPMLGAFLSFLIGNLSEKARDYFSVIVSFIPVAIAVRLYPLVQRGNVIFDLEWFLEVGIMFRVDHFGFLFIAMVSGIWFLATLYATEYMRYEHKQNRFYFFWLFSLGAILGVFVSGDLFGLFVFFEVMTIASYVLVVHEEDREAVRAGNLFLFLGIGGGLCILMGLFMIYAQLETLAITPLLGDMRAAGLNIPLISILFLIGFGIKAGMVPLHIWLPKAHPVAPTPASALLSGLLIKTGVYGMWRVFLVVMGPTSGTEHGFYLQQVMPWGTALFWIGIVTMFMGALMALFQTSAKKILAYSSVSQIGFVILGLGSAIYLGVDGPIGFASGLYHVLNHALFKACLFLVVGAIYIRTHLLDINKVRGMFKEMPFVGVTFIVAALGIAGVPLFNGYASKTLVHHALTEVYYLNPTTAMFIADKVFVLTSAMTVAYFIKLFRGLFLGPLPAKYKGQDLSVAPVIKVVLAVFMVLIIGIGVFPNFVLEQLISPTLTGHFYSAQMVQDQLFGVDLFQAKDLTKVLIVFFLAATITVGDEKYKWFSYQLPWWMSIEQLVYRPVIATLLSLITRVGTTFDVSLNDFFETTGQRSIQLCRRLRNFDKDLANAYDKSGQEVKKLANKTCKLEQGLDHIYTKGGENAQKMAQKMAKLDQLPSQINHGQRILKPINEKGIKLLEMLMKSGEDGTEDSPLDKHMSRRYLREHVEDKPKLDLSKLSVQNLNFDSFIIAVMLSVSLIVLILYNYLLW